MGLVEHDKKYIVSNLKLHTWYLYQALPVASQLCPKKNSTKVSTYLVRDRVKAKKKQKKLS